MSSARIDQKFCSTPCRTRNHMTKLGHKPRTPVELRTCACGQPRYKKYTKCADCVERRNQMIRERSATAKAPAQPPTERPCADCGQPYTPKYNISRSLYCSHTCTQRASRRRLHGWTPAPHRQPKPAKPPYVVELSLIRQALDEENWPGLIEAIRADVVESSTGCWEWARQKSKGKNGGAYAVVKAGPRGQRKFVHRLVVQAKLGGILPTNLPVHHACANTICVNPDHLMPVTHAENNIEMMQRHYYKQRIAELEAALSAISPHHPALHGRQWEGGERHEQLRLVG